MEFLPSASLRISNVPSGDAAWEAISPFGLSSDGYQWAGSLKQLAELANSTPQVYANSPAHELPELTLDELRACPFFEHRRFHHFGRAPDGPDLLYLQALVRGISDGLSSPA